jgi:hypothetical protein
VSSNRGHNKNLVLSRIGAGHRLQGLLGIERSKRTWDLALSIYDGRRFRESDCVDYTHRYKGGKWDGIHAFFSANPGLLDAYDFFWLVDDDIEATPMQVNEMFTYVQSRSFDIAQPALTLDSFYSHRLTLQCPLFSHRHTNFVELMMPVLSRNVLTQVMPFFRNTRSGLGLDWFWYRFASNPAESVAIIDAIAMPHFRPLNQHLRGQMKKVGLSAHDERQRAIRDWKLRRIYPIAFAGMLANGMRVDTRIKMSFLMTKTYWSKRNTITRPSWRWVDFFVFSIRQALSKL